MRQHDNGLQEKCDEANEHTNNLKSLFLSLRWGGGEKSETGYTDVAFTIVCII